MAMAIGRRGRVYHITDVLETGRSSRTLREGKTLVRKRDVETRRNRDPEEPRGPDRTRVPWAPLGRRMSPRVDASGRSGTPLSLSRRRCFNETGNRAGSPAGLLDSGL